MILIWALTQKEKPASFDTGFIRELAEAHAEAMT